MSLLGKITRGETTIDFVGRAKRWFTISMVMLVGSALALSTLNLDLGIEFKGGTAVIAENLSGASESDYLALLTELGVARDARVQLVGGDEGGTIRIQTAELDEAGQDALANAVAALSGSPRSENSIEAVSSSFGADVLRKGMRALVWFLVIALVFISIRLQFKMAVAGMIALFHDIVLTLGVYSVTGFSVTPATLVALLTIMGYSLYDTVVVFDKVEELETQLQGELTYSAIVNRAMNLVLFRSISTSLTSLLPVGSILFVGSIFFGATTLQDFALALFVGIGVGTYSSIFVAAPILAKWKEREEVWQGQRERIERRGLAGSSAQAVSAKVGAPRSGAAETPKAPLGAPRPPRPSGSKPRPPKKGRR